MPVNIASLDAELQESLVVTGDGVLRHPLGDFLVGTVLAGVGPRVAAVAIRERLDHARSFTGARAFDRSRRDLEDGVGVIAVDQ